MADVRQLVQEILDELVGTGAELGVQAAAFVDGKQIADAVAGPGTGRPVRPDTVFYNFSIGKGAMAALVHQQVDVGAFGDDIPVAELWPEFARHGKQAVTVRQVLDHAAGVPGIPPDTTVDTLADWPRMVAAMQVAEPSRPAARCRPGPSPGCTSRCSRSRRGAADQRGPAPGRVEAVLLRPDEVCGDESAWGLGYALGFPWDECARTAFGMAGAGGS